VGSRDVHEIVRWNQRLRYLEQASAMAGYEKIPLTAQRMLYRLPYPIPAIRNYDQLYRFAF
jgi:hypothetical protein